MLGITFLLLNLCWNLSHWLVGENLRSKSMWTYISSCVAEEELAFLDLLEDFLDILKEERNLRWDLREDLMRDFMIVIKETLESERVRIFHKWGKSTIFWYLKTFSGWSLYHNDWSLNNNHNFNALTITFLNRHIIWTYWSKF